MQSAQRLPVVILGAVVLGLAVKLGLFPWWWLWLLGLYVLLTTD